MIDLSLSTEATRAPELDDAYGIGWRLPNGSVVIVRARSATVVDGDASLDLLARPELPWVWRARHVALGLGLPPDTGFVWDGTTDPPHAHPSDLWAGVGEEIVWTTDTVGRGEIERDAVDAFARLENIDDALALEAEFGASSVLADLRALEPPPPVADIRVGRLGTTTHHRLAGEGLEVVRERRLLDGSVEEIDRQIVPWTSVDRRTDGFRMIAEAARDGVSVVVGRLHRSHVIEIETPEIRRMYFVPVSNRVSFPSESSWDAYVRSSDLAPHARVAIETRRPSLDDAAFAKPVSATLVSRDIVPELYVPNGEDARDDLQAGTHLEATAEDARRLGLVESTAPALDRVPDILVRPVNEALQHVADLAPPSPEVVHRERVLVREVWAGAGEAEVEYTVEVGEQAWPTLPDGTRAPDFTVDATGTLLRSVADVGTDGTSCGSCGRTLRSGEHICRSCAPITYLTAAEVGELPSVFAATGCIVGRQNDVPTKPYMLIGGRRTERFAIVDGRVAEWVSADKLGDEWMRLTIGLRRTLGLAGDVAVGRLGSRGAELPGEAGVQLDFEERSLAEYRVEILSGRGDDDGREGGKDVGDVVGRTELAKSDPLTTSDPVRMLTAVARALEIDDEPLPRTANSADTQMLTHLRAVMIATAGTPEPVAVLHIETVRVLDRLWCDRRGLHRVTANGEDVTIEDVEWTVETAPAEVRLGPADARAIARAELGSTKALVVHTNEGERIGVIADDAPIRWYQTAEPLFPR